MDGRATRDNAFQQLGGVRMATFLLLHGGAMGSWAWRYTAQALREKGHDVHTVTFTGFAERRHLISADCTTEMHVTDVLNTLDFADIEDCVLVAYSYAGSVAPGVIAVAPQRFHRVVYLDALVVRQGESVAEAMGYMSADQARVVVTGIRDGTVPIDSPVAEQQRAHAKAKGFWMSDERQAWMLGHLSSMPGICLVNPIAVGAESIKTPVEYITLSDTVMTPMHERAHKLGWNIHEVKGDHAILVGDPATTVGVLEKFA
jgi:pimeloyl-ACP methyl ester carboxylesterase